jgi:transposase InsO family protein
MQALPTRKANKDQLQIKGIFNNKPLEIVHTDLVGPTTTKGLKGERYFMLLVDDYTRMTAVCFLKNKSEAFENFKIYKEMVENEMDSRIKCLRSDNGGEFTSKEFMDYCSNHGIKRQFSSLGHLNRMELLKERTGQYKKWLKQ